MSKTIEILKFLRVMPEKKRLIQVRGKPFSDVDDIPDERVRHVIRQSIAEMVEMAGGYERLVAEGFLEPIQIQSSDVEQEPLPLDEADLDNLIEVKNEPKVETIAVKQEIESQAVDVSNAAPQNIEPKIPSTQFDSSSQPESGSLLNRFRSLTGRKPDKPAAMRPSLDIAGQINDVLQEKLESDRSFLGRQVELRSAPNGDLLFIIDGRSYDSVNDIPDEGSANLFRSAIAEWENR